MEKLQKVQKLIDDNQDSLFYSWHGITFSEQDVFSRLDKTFLYLLRPDKKIQRIIGYPELNEYRETRIEFTSSIAYRITTGKRKGRVVAPKKINSDERFETATIYKELCLGRDTLELNPENKGDSLLLDSFDGLVDNPPKISDTFEFPRFYLCCTGDDNILYPRQSGEAFAYFSSFDEFDIKKTLEQNIRDIFKNEDYALSAGGNRKAYLFEYMFGKGVVAVDLELDGKWFGIKRDKALFVKDFIKFDLDV